MAPEAHLIIGSGPRAGTVFVVPVGATRRFGSDPKAGMRLEGLPLAHSEVRFDKMVEIRDLDGHVLLNGQPLPAGFKFLRQGDKLVIGAHHLRVEMHGLDGTTLAGGTGHLVPQHMPAGYQIDGRLGSGAFGAVYAARRESDGQEVALKVLRRRPNRQLLKRFHREVQACQAFVHPHIVRVFEMGIDQDPPFIAMELIQGPSAEDLLVTGPLPVLKAVRIAVGLADALTALAEARFVHRDVKPANVLVAPGDHAKLADFGLAKDLSGQTSTLTASGVALGTLAYMAPEQLKDAKHAEPSADTYGLGATLYSLLSGFPPFQILTPIDVKKILDEEPAPITRDDCPARVLELIRSTMNKDASKRPPVASIADALRDVLASLEAAKPE